MSLAFRPLVVLCLAVGCSSSDPAPPSTPGPSPVTLQFDAVDAEGTPYVCGAKGLHVAGLTDVTPGDLRLYVHEVRLLKGDRAIPVTLDQDKTWQFQNVALLDFEDATAACSYVIFGKSKTPDTNRVLRGVPAEAGPYDGVEFTLGVPVALNHLETADSKSPLNTTGMDHGAADGRQFVRVSFYSDTTGATGDKDHNLLVFRSVCNNVTNGGEIPASADACNKPNRPTIRLAQSGGFDPAKDRIVVDVDAMFRGYTTPGTPGAHADLSDGGRIDCYGPLNAGDLGPQIGAERCGTFYPNVGLDYTTGRPQGTQGVFRVEKSKAR
ncbi:MbnP family protein [Polyangium sorediatum]|uniref:Metallo-mystery pair system four-Cys motif protein n=1 Tax=Polyangium sorediatum TaxID=889274 RepID=A0ABT6NMF1_9BACT|nr:MbnP family protein [Polyangium sorediatum]MDI1429501.1 metallo-mystery pair system four-Cys motif protein [Polyangium sorediatum]